VTTATVPDAGGTDATPVPPVLAVNGLSKRYGNLQALDDVSFELRAGEVMALLGENGAGKSTFVKVLAGLVEPDHGEVVIEGTPTSVHPVSASRSAGIAVVHQEFSSVDTLTVAENLALGDPRPARFWWPPRLNRQAKALLAQVGLEHISPRTKVERLSVAEKQLLEIARVLSHGAKVVIFDEPTAALADQDIARVLDVIRGLSRSGKSIIYVTHRLGEVFRIADRITVFRNGRGLEPVATRSITPDGVVVRMLGRRLDSMYPDRPALTGDPVIQVTDLRADGLDGPLSLTLRPGEILGLTGQLGSGVTEVLEALGGVANASSGELTIDGEVIPLSSRSRGIRHGVAFCSADRKLDGIFAEHSIIKNLSSPWLRSVSTGGLVSRARERGKAKAIATEFAIDVSRLSTPVGSLSGGNQQKVALGKWLGIRPRLLLVDEPTRGVDVGARAEIYERLRALGREGCAVIVASSDTPEVLGLCDTIATMYRGRLTALRPYDEWTEERLLLEVMHTNVEVTP
jgi:ribose transport system ATP-binding protein